MQTTDKLADVLLASEAKQVIPVPIGFRGFSLISYRHFTSQDENSIRHLLAFLFQRHLIEVVAVGGGYGCTRIEFEITSHDSSHVADLVLKIMKDEIFRTEALTVGFRVMILREPYVRLDIMNGNIQTDPITADIFSKGGTVNIDQSIHVGGNVTGSNLHSPGASASQGESIGSLLTAILKIAEEDSSVSKAEAISISQQVAELRAEIAKPSPSPTTVERILGNLGSIASITSLVDQVRPFLKALFP